MIRTNNLRIFIGYDSREPIAYHVLSHSLFTRAAHPISIIPLRRELLRCYTREKGPTESTEFSLTRFLVPHLSNYEGYSIFMDCDMLSKVDIWEIMIAPITHPDHSVWVCKHNYIPKSITKFLDQEQTIYPCKNWSSFMLFDNAKCSALTPEYVNSASGLELHRFKWLSDPKQVGSLPLRYNWLVEEYPHNDQASILHYTLGGPWFPAHRDTDHAADWLNEFKSFIF